ncbi:cytochrome c oxidase subunit I [Altericroceibacterium xinjiangense]|uniref:cytochrome c oxidase subunit I n=1 Tax=Altericroceibacterium xinjiangense TaxID=762261 RepID=UPI000F7E0959|nr:cytochrome c oxidase subunit I [Altericroceibacterium xinjiangense]
MSEERHNKALEFHSELDPLYSPPKTRFGFLAATNHSVIGIRFMATAIGFFLIGGILAMLIRAQLAGPNTQFLDPGQYSQVFTMHGTVMMFLFAIPLIEGFALYMLPKLLGARDLAFPRLSAFGYWCYLSGGLILLAALLFGVAPDSGWFMYTPLSSKPYSPGINADVWLLGVTVVEVSAACAAIEFMATVLKVRTGGMALSKMPILAWYLWATSAMMLVGFPPLILGSIMLEVERAFGLPFFDPDKGGDPLLWQHLFWLFGHPEVYIIFLPGAGIVSTILPVFARRPLVGYNWIVAALIAQAFISFGLWVHHMFTTGIPDLSLAFFSAASLLVVVPTAIQIFSWLTTLLKGRPDLSLPMLWIYGFFFIFVTGGLTGVMVAIVPFDWQVHDTHFVVAHLHYVLVGGFVFPVLAGIYHWMPLFTGRRSDKGLGVLAFWLVFIGFNLTFFIMHLTGLLGMPRRVYTYAEGLGWELPNLVSSIGGFMSAVGFGLVLIDVLVQWRFAPFVHRNPWKAGTLEWGMATPIPSYNFASLAHVESRDPLHDDPDLPACLAAGEGYLAGHRGDYRDTLGVDGVTGEPEQIILLPPPSYLPLLTALPLVGVALCFLFSFYVGSVILAVVVLFMALRWLWETGLREDPAPIEAGFGRTLLPHPAVEQAPGWWGMIFTLVFDATFFASLLFGYIFLWTIAPNWPPPRFLEPAPILALLTLASLGLGGFAASRAVAANRQERESSRSSWLLLAAASGVAATFGLLAVPIWLAPPPTEHAYSAAVLMLSAYGAFHTGLSTVGSLFVLARCRRGFVSPLRSLDVRNASLFWSYSAVSGAIIVAVIHLMPLVGAA